MTPLEFQTLILRYLLVILSWMSHEHLKGNVYKTKLFIVLPVRSLL